MANQSDFFNQLIQSNTNFAFNLFRYASPDNAANTFLSPFSITIALAMTYLGSDGSTKSELRSALFPGLDADNQDDTIHQNMNRLLDQINQSISDDYQLLIANRLYANKELITDLSAKYSDQLLQYYRSDLQLIDFSSDQARSQINRWVSEKTQEKIGQLIPSGVLNSMTQLILINAIYFKADWKYRFDTNLTSESDFYIGKSDQELIKVQMMQQERKLPYVENDQLQMLAMPYTGTDDQVSMYILLPSQRDGLGELKKSINAQNLTDLIKEMNNIKVKVIMPKFKLDQSFDLVAALKSLGAKEMFAQGKADFSKINGKKDVYISNVLHKAYIDVNEQGTEAAAATGVVGKARALLPTPTFVADHPFLFAIVDKRSMNVLFIGQYVGAS